MMAWNGMKKPNSRNVNSASAPRKRHCASAYPLSDPMTDDKGTDGITIRTEFRKNGCKPSHAVPVQAVPHAFSQAANVRFGQRKKAALAELSEAFERRDDHDVDRRQHEQREDSKSAGRSDPGNRE